MYICSVDGQSVDLFALKHQLVGVSIFPILSGDVRNVRHAYVPVVAIIVIKNIIYIIT